jgi:hypothetical protein
MGLRYLTYFTYLPQLMSKPTDYDAVHVRRGRCSSVGRSVCPSRSLGCCGTDSVRPHVKSKQNGMK